MLSYLKFYLPNPYLKGKSGVCIKHLQVHYTTFVMQHYIYNNILSVLCSGNSICILIFNLIFFSAGVNGVTLHVCHI